MYTDDMMTEYGLTEEEEEEERWDEPQMLEDNVGPQMVINSTAELQSPMGMPSASSEPVNLSSMSMPSTSSEPVNLMALNTNKAGMEGLNKDRINKIIMQASKGSRFYENEKKKESQVNSRVDQMRQRMAKLSEQEIRTTLIEIDKTVQELEASRDLSRLIVHLDMDAFYAAVEERDDPSLKDKPMAVGGMSMLCTSNYNARKYGVRAAMPGFIAKKLCPKLVLVPTNFDKYTAVSQQIREILAEYDANYCPMSLDEAYLDLTDHVAKRQSFTEAQRTFVKRDPSVQINSKVDLHIEKSNTGEEGKGRVILAPGSNPGGCQNKDGKEKPVCENVNSADLRTDVTLTDSSISSDQEHGERSTDVKGESVTFGLTVEDAVEEMRFRIEQRTQLTASAGIAPNCMLAKVCSDKNKPNGQYRVQPSREVVMDFINVLPIRKVSGIGKVTERMLSALGIQNCADLYKQRALLHILFSSISSQHFLRISLGLGSTQVERDSERKSMSTERTFHEINKPEDLFSKCRELCEALAEDLAQAELKGKTVGIKIKTVKFEVKTRVSTVPSPVYSAEELFHVAKDLLKTEIRACHPEPLRLRLMGVRLSSLEPKGKSNQNTITHFFKKKESSKLLPTTDNTHGETPKSENLHNISVSSSDKGQPSLPSLNHGSELVQLQENIAVPSNLSTGVTEGKTPSTSTSQLGSCSTNNVDSRTSTHSIDNALAAGNISLVCPVCNKIQTVDLATFNMHVDACLIGGTHKEQNSAVSHSETDNIVEDTPENLPTSLHDINSITSNGDDSRTTNKLPALPESQSTTSTSAEDQPSGSSLGLVCPICSREQRTSDLEEFNTHVDVCLNKGAIKEILHQQAGTDSQIERRQQSPTKGPAKRSGSTQQSAAKRRKQDKKQGPTLHKFFN